MVVYRYFTRLWSMRATRMIRMWDRKLAQYVQIPVQRPLDDDLACKDCRYFEENTHKCQGVGSQFYQKRVPHPNFVPRKDECTVRLSPDLLSFAGF